MTPRPESRLSELESKMAIQDARIRELSSDTAEELRVIRQDIKQLNDGMMASFKQIGDTFIALESSVEDIKTRLDKIESTQAEQGAKLDQILALLKQRPDK